MNLNIILGKSKTGKSKYIYDLMQDSINSSKETILFVPSQMRAIAEENYMSFLGKDGVIGAKITTISSYIDKNIHKYKMDFSSKYISKLDRKIILNQVINENKDIINIFKNVRQKEGFLDMLNIYMDIFRKSNINLENIEKLNIENKFLEYKLKEVASIYGKYIEKVNNNYVDSVDEYNIFLSEILNKNIELKGSNIFFDAYNNFTESEYNFIEKVLLSGANISISLNTDITSKEDIYSQNTQIIFENSNKTYLRLLSICNKLGVNVDTKYMYINYSKSNENIKYLANNIFSDYKIKKDINSNLEIGLDVQYVTNNYVEIEKVAQIICNKVRNGYRYNDFAIYTTDIDKYESIFKRVFYEYNIPVYINKKSSIKDSKLSEYITSILDLAIFGSNISKIVQILKLGLNDINLADIYELENYSIEFNLSKYSIEKEFTINNKKNTDKLYDLETLNNTREKIISIFKGLSNIKNKELISNEIVKIIYNHLVTNGILDNYKNYIIGEKAYALSNENFMRESQVFEKISEIFDSICKIYIEEKITMFEFYNVFKVLLKDSNIKIIPPSIDQVELLDINVNKISVKKQVFFIGVNENEFPKKIDEDIFFNDMEINTLTNNDIFFKESALSKNNMQLYNIYEAISNIDEMLYVFVPVSDMSGKNYRPSSLITNIKQLFSIEIKGNIAEKYEEDDIFKVYSKEKLFEYMCEDIIDNNYKKYSAALYKMFKEDKRYNTILNYKKDESNIKKEVLDLIYGNELTTSVSKLELFKKCPFSYYMKYCLKISPRKEYKITSIDMGSFMHNVLEEFSKYIFQRNIYWQSILKDGERLDKEYEKILIQIIESNLESVFGSKKDSIKYNILKSKLISAMLKAITTVAKSFNQSNFVPEGYEIEFKEGGIYTPIKLQLQDNKSMILIGKIDRVDSLEYEDNKYIRVVDYKSSSKNLNLDDIKEGLSLQLITYLTAFIENKDKNGEKAFPAAMVYFNLSDTLLTLSEYTDDTEKLKNAYIKSLQMKGIYLKDAQILKQMDNNFEQDNGRYISISKRTINSKNSKAIEENEFKNLCNEAKEIMKNIGNEITSGVVRIKPNKKANHCRFCEYSSVCRKNICL